MEKFNHEEYQILADGIENDNAPEKQLLGAILMSAIRDIKTRGVKAKQAETYFLRSDDEHIFSFKSICEFLELDQKKVLQITGLEKKNK